MSAGDESHTMPFGPAACWFVCDGKLEDTEFAKPVLL